MIFLHLGSLEIGFLAIETIEIALIRIEHTNGTAQMGFALSDYGIDSLLNILSLLNVSIMRVILAMILEEQETLWVLQ